MKELYLYDRSLSNEDADVFAGELIDFLYNLKEMTLELNVSPEMASKLESRGDELGCDVYFYID